MNGFIKIERKLLDWEWWSDINTTRLFIFLLLSANWRDRKCKGVNVPRGSVDITLPQISTGTGLTIRQSRTALEHLKSTGEVTVQRHHFFSIITIVNYDYYQSNDSLCDSPSTDKRQANRQTNDRQVDSQATDHRHTTEEYKNIKKKEHTIAHELFDKLWSMYPRKLGKGNVSDTQKEKLLKIGEEEMTRCIQRYKDAHADTETQYIMYGSTFFNSGYVDYLDENFSQAEIIPFWNDGPPDDDSPELTDEEWEALEPPLIDFGDEGNTG